jgi:hypothetical protein
MTGHGRPIYVHRTMRKVFLAVLIAAPAFAADWPENVTEVKSEKGKKVEVKGDLSTGKPIEDLSWAANSSVACFPATQNEKFRGPHVLFRTSLPTRSEMFITVKPDDDSKDLSLYAYSIGQGKPRVVPDLPSCVSCEAEHKWDRPKKGKTQDSSRTIRLNAIQNPYDVVIGVSGPKDATGAFTLSIETK